jgi:hypothetical protein
MSISFENERLRIQEPAFCAAVKRLARDFLQTFAYADREL